MCFPFKEKECTLCEVLLLRGSTVIEVQSFGRVERSQKVSSALWRGYWRILEAQIGLLPTRWTRVSPSDFWASLLSSPSRRKATAPYRRKYGGRVDNVFTPTSSHFPLYPRGCEDFAEVEPPQNRLHPSATRPFAQRKIITVTGRDRADEPAGLACCAHSSCSRPNGDEVALSPSRRIWWLQVYRGKWSGLCRQLAPEHTSGSALKTCLTNITREREERERDGGWIGSCVKRWPRT